MWLLIILLYGDYYQPTPVAPTITCTASIFAQPGDKYAGGKSRWLKREVHHTDSGIAHRFYPLGSWVRIKNLRTGLSTHTQVIDRGPYGAMHEGEWVIKKRRSDPGRWRGCADLTPPVAEKIDHNGFERISIVRISPPTS